MKWGHSCRRCKQINVVTDHVTRRTRCFGCGLEFKYRPIGDGSPVAENDTVRLPDPTNTLLSNTDLSIVTTEHKNGSFDDSLSLNLENSSKPRLDPVSIAIAKLMYGSSNDFLSLTLGTSQNSETITASSDEFLFSDLGHLQKFSFDPLSMASTKPNKALSIVSIEAISNGLKLPATIKSQANEIFKVVESYARGKERNVLLAACIYIACRDNDMTRTMREISRFANKASISDISETVGFIAEKLEIEKNWYMSIETANFIKRFCSIFRLDKEAVEAALEAAESYDYMTNGCSRRAPVSVAAGIVYVIARLSYEKHLLKGLIEATGVAENTIKGTYGDLYPNLPTIVPTWFANANDLKNLGAP
ncbi:putative transcription factor TFIIB, Cyclin-like superfamily [Arabidopsis thaliana]|uniref:Transcription factor TFIIB cyclin-like domain-containing protein n=1 Tax=Arabidopsis thaliana TaxID=3702 RepID=A0A178V8X6_ARATH|nr:hypothetical protein AXX17_AT3G51950 [Arabidopsis thaliana]